MSASAASIRASYALVKRQAINPWIIAVTVTLATFMELLTKGRTVRPERRLQK